MISKWGGFPMGFRFVVKDFSADTKRVCWDCLLSALERGKSAQVLLFDEETISTYDDSERIYLCILSHKPIKQSRANADLFVSDPLLMSMLSIFEPIVQENELNTHNGVHLVGLVKANGEIAAEDVGRDILPAVLPLRRLPMASRHILAAPDSMKGTFSSFSLARLIAHAAAESDSGISTRMLPVGDGGEGTMLSLASAMHGRMLSTSCRDAYGKRKQAAFAVLPDGTAVIECAQAVGFADAGDGSLMQRTSAGVGDLILRAVNHGYGHICLCVGGTSSSDCGIGMLGALGVRFFDEQDVEVPPVVASLPLVKRVDVTGLPTGVQHAAFTVYADSFNPLLGSDGAVCVYAPQKGASPDDVTLLEKGFETFSAALDAASWHEYLPDGDNGAGGGIAFAAARVLCAQIVRGIDALLDLVGFDALLDSVSCVFTAEGSFDMQSIAFGKATKAIIDRCEQHAVPCILLAGRVSEEASDWLRVNTKLSKAYACDSRGADGEKHLETLVKTIIKSI